MINWFSINCDLVAKNKSKEKIEKEIFLSFYFAEINQWDTDFDVKVKREIEREKCLLTLILMSTSSENYV